ncbi:serine hydrolase-like protein [Pectinophora gossypiella]|uniref:serine hydrolase-like protein n=1 Tax=Pectinophora gossypiella TaxID=13191 RepID=UPI00214EFE48|nr:serine hydrolase-like protein [Pectinophora gossypiella]XP_049883471.1 serine hydrolase-like protein [Pectinophora gossypiella]
MKEVLKEWFMQAPWGKLALISWGSPVGEPVLLVHGRQDSAATFVPLLGLLPNEYHYVAFDLPGHGKSDPFPVGVMLSRFHFVIALDVVVKHLQWKSFVYLSHSMGGEIGLYYNAVRPNHITKFLFLDIGPALQNLIYKPYQSFYTIYDKYYSNYNSMNNDDRVYSKRKALDAVLKARGLTEDLAELVLSRNLREIGQDVYRLSWDKRLKNLTHLNLPNEFCLKLYTNIPPTLFVEATSSVKKHASLEVGRMIEEMRKKVKNFEYRIVEGTHDVHLTNPERIASDVTAFLKREFAVSKL